MLELPNFSEFNDFAVGKAIGDDGKALSPCLELLRRNSFGFFAGLFSRWPFFWLGGGGCGGGGSGLGEGGGDDGEGYGEFEEVETVVVWDFVFVVIVGFWGLNSRGDGRVVRGFGKGFEFGV